MGAERVIRLMIVDRHPLVRWALSHMVDNAPDVVTVAGVEDATEARTAVATLQPDVAVIDCSLGDGEGWDLARDLRDRYQDLGIVILTAEGSDDVLFRALDSGASSFVSKLAPWTRWFRPSGMRLWRRDPSAPPASPTRSAAAATRHRSPRGSCSAHANSRFSNCCKPAYPFPQWQPRCISASRPPRPTWPACTRSLVPATGHRR